MYTQWITISITFTLFTNFVIEGQVDILSPQPFYVEYGSNMTLHCVSDRGRELEWLQDVLNPQLGWLKEVITPVIGSSYITRYTIEKPSLYVESILTKVGIVLEDRGLYQCRDNAKENSFDLWVSVLYISKQDVIAEPSAGEVYLYCSIEGFNSNMPYIDYYWYYREETIIINHKYDIVYKDGSLQLNINQLEPDDGGEYTCSFILQTNQEPMVFSKSVNLDTTELDVSSSSWLHNTSLVTIATISILLVMLSSL